MTRILDAEQSFLLMIDFQTRLMPAISDNAQVIANAGHLARAARLLKVPMLYTEQNPLKLGQTIAELEATPDRCFGKMTFDAGRTAGFMDLIAPQAQIIIAGCEAHVCVLQTAIGLISAGRHVFIAADATGSRRSESKSAALSRLEKHGAEIVTTEMVLFEWLTSAAHPHFREIVALIK